MKHLAILVPLALIAACSPAQESDPSAAASEPMPTLSTDVPVSSPARDVAPSAEPVPTEFKAIGTEPFWSAEIKGAKLSYSTPEAPAAEAVAVWRRDESDGVVYSGVIDGKPIELEVHRETCSDGMSDTVYPLSVVRRIGPDSQRGCAR